jgi:hypothetical protein
VIRKRNLFDKKEKLLISKNLVIRKRKAFDLKRKVFDLQEYCQNKKKLI